LVAGLLAAARRFQPNITLWKDVTTLSFVMKFAGNNLNGFIGDFINQPVVIVDSSRPAIFELMLQGFWFTGSGKWTAPRFFN
jgi:hypothetical protein